MTAPSLWKGGPVKALTEGKHSNGGRNNHGRITSQLPGRRSQARYRIVDFKRRKYDVRRRSSGSSTIRTAPRSSR